MKSAQQVQDMAEKAIRANFAFRNARSVLGNPNRHRRMVAERCRQVREWCDVLRVARDPSKAASIAHVTNAGPLPAHALRSRVLSLIGTSGNLSAFD
jgi:hypothetical protein